MNMYGQEGVEMILKMQRENKRELKSLKKEIEKLSMPQKKWITRSEACDLLGVSKRTLQGLEIRFEVKRPTPQTVLINRKSVEDFIENSPNY